MSWILAKNSSNDIALDGSDSNMPANTGVRRSLSPLKIKASKSCLLQIDPQLAKSVLA